MKKILILGGNALSCDIVTTARAMGLYTIVTDWNSLEDSPAKQIADEAWNISLTDYNELERRIKDEHIEGVFTNYTDSYLIPYVIICNRCSLPCLATIDQINTISNKNLSKQLCIDHGIEVSSAQEVSSVEELESILPKIKFPVITKPIDQSGQRGIFVCNSPKELKHFYEESLKFTHTNKILIEEYLQGDYVVMFYTIQNGVVSLASMADKPVAPVLDKNQVRLPLAYILPSRHIGLCEASVLPKVQDFVITLGIMQGVIGIEAIVCDNHIKVFEMQFRLGGMRHHEFVLQENGMNIMEMLLRFAVSGKFEGWNAKETDNAHFKHMYVMHNVLIKTGTIGHISGIDEICKLPFVTKVTQMSKEGDTISLAATVQQILCKISMKLSDSFTLKAALDQVYNLIQVVDEYGNDMVTDYWKTL